MIYSTQNFLNKLLKIIPDAYAFSLFVIYSLPISNIAMPFFSYYSWLNDN